MELRSSQVLRSETWGTQCVPVARKVTAELNIWSVVTSEDFRESHSQALVVQEVSCFVRFVPIGVGLVLLLVFTFGGCMEGRSQGGIPAPQTDEALAHTSRQRDRGLRRWLLLGYAGGV